MPDGAVVIDGTGLTAYPGFVDAGNPRGHDGTLRKTLGGPPAAEDLGDDVQIATKPDHRRGLTPEFEVRGALKADEEAATNWRKLGFTAHLVTPEGGIASGQSSVASR